MQPQAPLPPKKPRWINPLRDRTRVIPFVVPNKEEQMNALGTLVGEKWRIKKSIQAVLSDFDPIKKPQPGDNLYQYEEDGQGFGLFASMARNHIDKQEQIIYIATFYSKISKETIRAIKRTAKAFFLGVKIKFHDYGSKEDLAKFEPIKSETGELYYDASRMNTYFAKNLPKHTYSIAILTNLLIYNGDNIDQRLSQRWCFGLGSIKDRTCVISFEEIVKKGYGNLRENQNDEDEVNIDFLIKVVNHQICHTFGMRHCIYYRCLMNGTNHYKEAIKKVPHLCPVCLRKLHSELDFDFAERYEALGDEKSLQLANKVRHSLKIVPR